ncbi:hypothetical protein K9M50_00100 [Patescibacteria group bacterium]|nr:hypothetical protein [Patescibacteria group bacterium]
MDSEDDKNIEVIEEDDLNAEKELRCTKKGIEKESWSDVDGCLNKFLIKFQDQDNSEEDVKTFRKIFLEVKELLATKKIPKKDKYRIDSTIEHINRLLEF